MQDRTTISGVKRKIGSVSVEGRIETVPSQLLLTAFGELKCAQPTPLLQEAFPYPALNARKWTTTGTGTASSTQGLLTLTGDTSVSSRVRCRYRPGQGLLARFTAVFANASPQPGETALIGLGDDTDGFFFEHSSLGVRIVHRRNGSDTYVAQADWNIDSGRGSTGRLRAIDWTKGNVCQIQLQYLGFGAIIFSVEDNESGRFEPVHQIKYAGLNDYPSLTAATLPFRLQTVGSTLSTASVGVFVEGLVAPELGLTNSLSAANSIGAAEQSLLVVRNKSLVQTTGVNHDVLRPLLLTCSIMGGNKPLVLRLITDATFGVAPTYADVDLNASLAEYSTELLTVTSGQAVTSVVISTLDGSAQLPLADLGVSIAPGETLTIAASTTGGTTEAFASLTWSEDL